MPVTFSGTEIEPWVMTLLFCGPGFAKLFTKTTEYWAPAK
jgi:hypothetical protein